MDSKIENLSKKTNHIYKEIKCQLCNRTYKNNYFYTHKKSKSHLKKSNGLILKANLLKDDETKDNNIITNNDLITSIKNDAQNILSNINLIKI
jgi:hypothetical protein